jgi:hypothetical protein
MIYEPMVTASSQRQGQLLQVQFHTAKIPIVAAAPERVVAPAGKPAIPHEILYGSLMTGGGPARQYALLTTFESSLGFQCQSTPPCRPAASAKSDAIRARQAIAILWLSIHIKSQRRVMTIIRCYYLLILRLHQQLGAESSQLTRARRPG